MKHPNVMHKKIYYFFGVNFFMGSDMMTFFGKTIYNFVNSICAYDCRYAGVQIYANVLPLLFKDL